MGLEEQAAKYLKGRQVIIVTSSLDSEGYLQEIAGTLLDAVEGCLIVEQGEEAAPTLVNPDHVAWVYEDASDDEYEDDEDDADDADESV